jgi:hypothetical protein
MPHKHRLGRTGIALTTHDLGVREEWVTDAKLRPLFPEKDLLLFILQEAESNSGQVSTGAGSLSRTRTQISDRQAHSQSLYRLSVCRKYCVLKTEVISV